MATRRHEINGYGEQLPLANTGSIKPDGGGNQATVRLQVSGPHNSFAEEAPGNGRLGKGLVAEYQGSHKGRIASTCPFLGRELPAPVSVLVVLHDIR